MSIDVTRGIRTGAALRSSVKDPFEAMTGSVMDAFEKKRDIDFAIDKALAVERAKSSIMSPLDQAKIDLYKKQAESYDKGDQEFLGNPQNIIQQAASSSGRDPQDFRVKPVVTRYRGRARTSYVPEEKPLPPEKFMDELIDNRVIRKDLQKNVDMMTPGVKKFMNPLNPLANRGGFFGGTVVQLGSMFDKDLRDFAVFKAESDKVFQRYRKWVTGVQASFPELKWLVIDYPQPDDSPELYLRLANEAMSRMEQNENLFLDAVGGEYRVSQLRSNNRADMASDATTSQSNDPLGLFQ